MKINIDNYEAFFLDFVEGRLNDSLTLELLTFLNKYPHLKNELENFADIKLPLEEVIFTGKDLLTKFEFSNTPINSANFDDYCIAYYEKILSNSEAQHLLKFLSEHPEKRKSFDLFGKIKLKSNKDILFEGKASLLKKDKGGNIRILALRWSAVAAGIALFVSLIFIYEAKDKTQNISVNTYAKSVHVLSASRAKNIDSAQSKAHTLSHKTTPVNSSSINRKEVPENEMIAVVSSIDSSNLIYPAKELEPIQATIIYDSSENKRLVYIEDNREEQLIQLKESEINAWDYEEDRLVKKVFKKTGLLPKKKITLWDIAQVTIKGYNSISEKDIKLSKETNKNGKLTAIALETENRKYGFKTRN